MMGILGYLTGLILCVAVPPMLVAGVFSFYQMDIGLMNPANWHQSARFVAIIWSAAVFFSWLVDTPTHEHEDYYYD